MRSYASLIIAPFCAAFAMGLMVLFFMGVVAIVDFTDSMSHMLWPVMGALPIVTMILALPWGSFSSRCERMPPDSGIQVATPTEVCLARMAEAKRVFLAEGGQSSPTPKVRKRTKRKK